MFFVKVAMKKKKNKGFWKTLALFLVCIMSIFTLSACMGMGGGLYGSGSSSGGSSGGSSGETPGGSSGGREPSKPDDPKDVQESTYIDDYNDVFLGGIGVYDVDHTAKVFYNKYSNEFVDFDTLLNRQFETLATVLYEHLNYVYGTSSFYGSLSAFNATFDNNLNSPMYNTTDSLKYPGTMNSEYTLIKIETKDPATQEVISTTFEYVNSLSAEDAGEMPNSPWNLPLAASTDMVGALRYIYKNTIPTANSVDLNLSDATLSSAYDGFSNSDNDNSDIKTIGFTKDYMWNVLYYIAYGVIGEVNITNSNNASSVVAQAATVDADNYTSFNKYKGYERILPEIVEKAFKMVESGGTITKSDYYYCFDVDNYSKFAEDTIFPILNRKEYIFFDDINDICDAEKDEFIPGNNDSDNPKKDLSFDDLENQTIKVGSLRKLEKIIMLPNIKSGYKLNEFSCNDLFLCLTTESGEMEVRLSKNVIDRNGAVVQDQVKFTGNGYSIDIGDGKKIEAEPGEEITDQGHLILNDFPSVNKNSQFVSLFEDAKTAEAFKYTSIADTSLVTNAFKEDKYTVATTGEEINMARLNVNNKLFKIKVDENGDYEWTVDIDKNLIELIFEYYAKGGSKLDNPSPVYLLAFDFM